MYTHTTAPRPDFTSYPQTSPRDGPVLLADTPAPGPTPTPLTLTQVPRDHAQVPRDHAQVPRDHAQVPRDHSYLHL